MQQSILDRIFKRWRLLLLLVIAGSVVYMLYNYGFMTISVTNSAANKPVDIKYIDQRTGDAKIETLNNSSVTKLVRRSSYQIYAAQDNASGYSVVKTSGFLQKTESSIVLKQRLGLQFIGDSPGACMNYVNSRLFSYDCVGTSINIHVPATTQQPTYNKPVDLGIGNIEGIVATKEGLVAVAQSVSDDDSSSASHSAYLLNSSLSVTGKNSLSSLKSSIQYSVKAFKDGFIVYSEDFTDIQYFASISASPQKIKLNSPDDNEQKPYKLAVAGDGLLAEYSSKAGEQEDSTGKGIGKAKVTMVLSSGGQSRQFHFKTQFDEIGMCRPNKMCLLDSYTHNLSVYDVSGDKAEFLYKQSGVDAMATNAKQTIVASGNDVVSLDVDSMSGYNIYTSSSHKTCGIQLDKNGYVVCIGGDKNSAIFLSSSVKYDSIDKKIAELQDVPEVTSASVYKNLIFISPNLGDPVYVPSINGFGYDPGVKKQTYTAINSELSVLGLSSGYRITINGLP